MAQVSLKNIVVFAAMFFGVNDALLSRDYLQELLDKEKKEAAENAKKLVAIEKILKEMRQAFSKENPDEKKIMALDKKSCGISKDNQFFLDHPAKLDLSKLGLTQLPAFFCKLMSIYEVDLSENRLTQLPPFYNVENNDRRFCKINLSNNELVKVPEALRFYPSSFNLSKNQLTTIPVWLLTRAEPNGIFRRSVLDLSYNKIQKLPEPSPKKEKEYPVMYQINELDLSHNQIKELPKNFRYVAVRALDLSYNQLTSFNASSGNDDDYGYLNLSHNQITRVGIVKMKVPLQDYITFTKGQTKGMLDLSHNQLTEIPETFVLDGNGYTVIGVNISEYFLLHLNLSHNKISSFPADSTKLSGLTKAKTSLFVPRLETLDLSFNHIDISTVPASVVKRQGYNFANNTPLKAAGKGSAVVEKTTEEGEAEEELEQESEEDAEADVEKEATEDCETLEQDDTRVQMYSPYLAVFSEDVALNTKFNAKFTEFKNSLLHGDTRAPKILDELIKQLDTNLTGILQGLFVDAIAASIEDDELDVTIKKQIQQRIPKILNSKSTFKKIPHIGIPGHRKKLEDKLKIIIPEEAAR